MPPKSKGGVAAPKAPEPELPPPKTVHEQARRRFYLTNPIQQKIDEVGNSWCLQDDERLTWANSLFIDRIASKEHRPSNKVEKEFWKQVAKDNIPFRSLNKDYHWGQDIQARDVGDYTLEEFDARVDKQVRLHQLSLEQGQFIRHRDLVHRGTGNSDSEPCLLTEVDLQRETERRKEMATLKKDLYGHHTESFRLDPQWDDVTPIPAPEDQEATAATIAYPEDYAEATAYLRAVMASEEHSTRCLRLTEQIISMNAAHYTVWLYRFKIVATLDIPMADEIAWLNGVALENLKNYQIWHHRQLLADHYLPKMSENAEEVKKFARSEMQFLGRILEEDTKNYHVWSYRQYLVGKLNLFSLSELLSTQNFIEDDVRNNSAWSHRFFLIFSDPSASTKGSHATEPDPKIAAETVDREIAYCKEKIDLAPQNQSPWNYLKAVLIKGGRDFQELKDFALRFVNDLGGEEETVTSTHALEFLATMYEEAKDDETALVCLRRLSDKWDASRAEYWIYREQMLLFREP